MMHQANAKLQVVKAVVQEHVQGRQTRTQLQTVPTGFPLVGGMEIKNV